jgi:hypothetical protein
VRDSAPSGARVSVRRPGTGRGAPHPPPPKTPPPPPPPPLPPPSLPSQHQSTRRSCHCRHCRRPATASTAAAYSQRTPPPPAPPAHTAIGATAHGALAMPPSPVPVARDATAAAGEKTAGGDFRPRDVAGSDCPGAVGGAEAARALRVRVFGAVHADGGGHRGQSCRAWWPLRC